MTTIDLEPGAKVRWRNGTLIVQDPRSGFWATRLKPSIRAPMEHELKAIEPYFEEAKLGRKTFEFRRADRDFRLLDTLRIREWDPVREVYTGREVTKRIGFILIQWTGLDPDYVVLSLIPTMDDIRQRGQDWVTRHPAPPVIPKEVIATSEALQAQVDKMRAALVAAQAQFLHYAHLHQDKGTEDGLIKAQANRDHANQCAQALL